MNRLRQAFADLMRVVCNALYEWGDEEHAWDSRAHPCIRLGDWIESNLADPSDLRYQAWLSEALRESDEDMRLGRYKEFTSIDDLIADLESQMESDEVAA